MIILTLRTDQPEAEIRLYDNQTQVGHETWEAHRQLSSTIHTKIRELLESQGKEWADLGGIVCFSGPGSFTGLRIGATVANTIAATLEIPVTGTNGDDWIEHGIDRILNGRTTGLVTPFYGRGAHITTPRK